MASPTPSSDGGVVSAAAAAVIVCCMCGDHGLPRELYRCNHCRIRTQHRYCSDLYPAAAGPYRSCNWCLRQQGGAVGGGGGSPSPVKESAAAAGPKRRIDGSRGDGRDSESARYGCSRSAFSADPGKPIKKPKRGRERAVQRPAEPVVATVSKETREVVQPGKPRFKVKVRRYKLLAEVIC